MSIAAEVGSETALYFVVSIQLDFAASAAWPAVVVALLLVPAAVCVFTASVSVETLDFLASLSLCTVVLDFGEFLATAEVVLVFEVRFL